MTVLPPPPHRPFGMRLVNGVGRVAGRALGPRPSLAAEALRAEAVARTGFDDFGPLDFVEGLECLIDSLEREAQLHVIGRISAKTQIVDALSVRLELLAHRKAHPEVDGERIERPLFVLGLPRTGTTILYELLALDPSSRSPVMWELSRPCPPPEPETYANDPRIAPIEQHLARFRRMVPTLDAIHPMGATLPQECLVTMAPSFRSYQFPLSFHVPSYVQWCTQADLAPAYHFHRFFLQHLQSRFRRERWVLKSPAHLGQLDALLAMYPDARVIQTHRDPVEVIPSVSSLHHVVRGFGSDGLDPHALGAAQVEYWGSALTRTMASRDQRPDLAQQFTDVHFEELLADPIAVVERVYAHFQMPLVPSTVDVMRAYLAAHPRGVHGQHQYSLEMFGLNAAGVAEKFGAYRARHGYDVGQAPAARTSQP
ncbi:MAG: sulfotransferase [Sandaracinaceae bacterium]|nr:sulfotransferase [Sandaracinaceae bacterium]MBK6807474.1 sulfotransferase [Sandaracinaceae bacterium]MBK7152274.1 sulfotransferase [Sandaracinaceae bacterium]MBK7774583.1 sulfotransferase [Sandaracinaceae bacterium]MBP7684243.1 sulfotransferase [Deltaproteobacteria bacterium]